MDFPKVIWGMNFGKYVFSQVVSVINPNDFKICVDRYKGNYKVKDFTCWAPARLYDVWTIS